jgi:hypothetical protein
MISGCVLSALLFLLSFSGVRDAITKCRSAWAHRHHTGRGAVAVPVAAAAPLYEAYDAQPYQPQYQAYRHQQSSSSSAYAHAYPQPQYTYAQMPSTGVSASAAPSAPAWIGSASAGRSQTSPAYGGYQPQPSLQPLQHNRDRVPSAADPAAVEDPS